MPENLRKIHIIDSHTAGEPTRLVIAGGPDLGSGTMAERLENLRTRHDDLRTAVVNEPRGSDVIIGALLCPPVDPASAAGVIFFNNVGYLGMCGHGTIGLITTLAHLGRIAPGKHQIETPVGNVGTVLHADGRVSVANVPSYRTAARVAVKVPGHGKIEGDIAWGGNWFFLVYEHPHALELANVDALTAYSWAIRQALAAQGLTGENGAEIDHIELYGPGQAGGNSRNFVLCPGKAYDRSPCGTGTSAKLACLYADGKLAPGATWKQEGILGTSFEGSVEVREGKIHPTITGRAYVNADAQLLLDPNDPFCQGITVGATQKKAASRTV